MEDRRSDPTGFHEQWEARLKEAIRAYTEGEFPMSNDVFRATLYSLGFRGEALKIEFNDHYYNKLNKNITASRKPLDSTEGEH